MTKNINLEFALSHKCLNPQKQQLVYLMLQFKQPKVDCAAKRKPLNVSFVVDRSGSMEGAKLDYTKQAVAFALRHLEPVDVVSLVAFDDEIKLAISAEPAQDKDLMIQAVKKLQSGGCTNLSGGLLKGVSEVKKNLSKEYINRVVLLTDGLANQGITDPKQLVKKVQAIKNQHISVSAMGVGADFAEDLLVEMAEAGSGNFYFIANPDQIPEIFRQELEGLLSITGQNLELAVTPAHQVKLQAVLGYQPSWGSTAKFNLPDIYHGDIKTVLLEPLVTPQQKGTLPLVSINFKYDNVLAELATVNYEVSVDLEVTEEPALLENGLNIQVIKEVEMFRTAEAKEVAVRLADEGKFEEASEVLRCCQNKLEQLSPLAYDSEVLEEIARLQQDTVIFEAQNFTAMDRKQMKYQSYLTRNKR